MNSLGIWVSRMLLWSAPSAMEALAMRYAVSRQNNKALCKEIQFREEATAFCFWMIPAGSYY